jgi:hypothetical protein
VLLGRLALGLQLLAIVFYACIGEKQQVRTQPVMNVELDVFSGRENPKWELSGEDVSILRKKMTGLASAKRYLPELGFGYRGFVISVHDPTGDIPSRIRVFRGVISTVAGDIENQYQDMHGLEGWLFEQARERGYGDLLP